MKFLRFLKSKWKQNGQIYYTPLANGYSAFHIVTIQKDNKPTKVVLLDYPTIEDAKKSASLETLSVLNEFNVELQSHIITLDYSCWKTEDILHSVLPIDSLDGAPATFAMTRHVAHINLRDEYLPYKKLIGQVILDKSKQ